MSRIFGEAGRIAWVVPELYAAFEHSAEVVGMELWRLGKAAARSWEGQPARIVAGSRAEACPL